MQRALWLWLYERRERIPLRLRRLRCRLVGHHPNLHSITSDDGEWVSHGPCLWCRHVVAEGEMVEWVPRYGWAFRRIRGGRGRPMG
jgi:hypothetical protein